jgi:hypothetical protein
MQNDLERLARAHRRMPNTTVQPVYTGPGTGYLGTGFTLEEVCALGVMETHPAIMRYDAYVAYLRRMYPSRGSRPAGSRAHMTRLHASVPRARATVTPAIADAYLQRWVMRNRGDLEENLPRIAIPRGRTRNKAREPQRPAVRPAQSWHEQALQDLRVLIELKHPIPYSRTPTQTRRRKDTYAFESVPIPDQYHPPRACRGKRNDGARCRHCMVDGKRHTARPMALGMVTGEQSAPVLPRVLRGVV